MKLRLNKTGDSLHEYTSIVTSFRHGFWPDHAAKRKRIMSDLKRGMELFRHVPGGFAGAVYENQSRAYKMAKGTKANGPSWYAVLKCDNCVGMQLTDSSVPQARRWICVTCGEICDIAWVEDSGRTKAIESLEKFIQSRVGEDSVQRSAWDMKAIKMHRKVVMKDRCKVKETRGTCDWCD